MWQTEHSEKEKSILKLAWYDSCVCYIPAVTLGP